MKKNHWKQTNKALELENTLKLQSKVMTMRQWKNENSKTMRNETKWNKMRYARKEWKFKGMKGETKIEMIEKQSNIKQTQKLKEENDLVKYALGHLF